MRGLMRLLAISSLAAMLSGVAAPAAAQVTVTSTEIQRLQDQLSDASAEVSRLRSRDADLATRLESELDQLRDEAIYLKVKLRKEGSVRRSDYVDVHDRIQDVLSRARNDRTGIVRDDSIGTTGARTSRSDDPYTLPVGTELDVRLQDTLDSSTVEVEQRFEATTAVDVMKGERVLIPAGSVMRGIVTSVERPTRTNRTARMTVSFDQITVRGRAYPIRATVTDALETEGIKEEVGRIGTGAGVGAIIGGILGGVKGALAGILIGGGGTIAATEGKDLVLQTGTVLRVRLDTPLAVR